VSIGSGWSTWGWRNEVGGMQGPHIQIFMRSNATGDDGGCGFEKGGICPPKVLQAGYYRGSQICIDCQPWPPRKLPTIFCYIWPMPPPTIRIDRVSSNRQRKIFKQLRLRLIEEAAGRFMTDSHLDQRPAICESRR
jgi:hypothetical protein